MSDKMELGRMGEEIAVKLLTGLGYRIRERNWRAGNNEIDIIAQDGNYLVIVEVKTRSSTRIVEPEVAVTRDKQRALIRAANRYIRFHSLNLETRFDIVSVVIAGEQHEARHIPDAFYPML